MDFSYQLDSESKSVLIKLEIYFLDNEFQNFISLVNQLLNEDDIFTASNIQVIEVQQSLNDCINSLNEYAFELNCSFISWLNNLPTV